MSLPEGLVASIRRLKEVGGCSVGYAGAPSRFYTLMTKVFARADDRVCEQLLSDRAPVVRAMGVLCAVHLHGVDSVGTLRGRLHDGAAFVYRPGGCVGYPISVGGFAAQLLDRGASLCAVESAPLLAPSERLTLQLAIYADDFLVHARDPHALEAALADGTLKLRWPLPQSVGSGLERWQIVKAIGRWVSLDRNREERTRRVDFLLAAMRDESASPSTRLAAASALTRVTDVRVARAIANAHAALDATSHSDAGSRIEDAMRARLAHERLLRPIRRAQYVFQNEPQYRRMLTALDAVRPLALADVLDSSSFGRHDGLVERARERALLRVVEQLPSVAEPWNTYSDSEAIIAWTLASSRALGVVPAVLERLPLALQRRFARALSSR